MSSPAFRTSSRSARVPAFLAAMSIAAAVLLANAVYLFQLRTNNPIAYHSGLGSPEPGTVRGMYTIDANDGWTAQTLGRLAAESWLHGHVPLWNYFEGLGQPLAGEMQSAALFLPFILLQALPNGIFLMHLALELVAGLSTLMFLRTLRLSWLAASIGGILFALNGAHSVMTNAPFNPIAFLPMALWGVELIRHTTESGRRPRAGLWITAFAFAFMLFAGFPETALLEGLFVALWTVIRLLLSPTQRKAFAAWTAGSVAVGVALAAPILVAFKDHLDYAFLAYHSGVANNSSYPMIQITSLALPYASGPLGNEVFGLQAGYVTLAAVFLAIIGFLGKRPGVMKAGLGAAIALLLLNTFGHTPVKDAINLVPGVKNILVNKYGLVLIEFVVIMFAALGIDDVRRARVRARSVAVATLAVGAYLIGSVVALHNDGYLTRPHWSVGVVGWTAAACVLLAGLALASKRARLAGTVAIAAASILVVDAGGTYAVPQLSATATPNVDMAPVRFLQANLGNARFFTLGPIQPNYGSYWGLAQLNANDLPIPQQYSTYVEDELRPPASTLGSAKETERIFSPYQLVAFNPPAAVQRKLLQAYGQRQDSYRRAAVKYVVMRAGVSDAATAETYGLQLVHRSAKVEIWQDARAAAMYTTAGARCAISAATFSGATLDCPAAAVLTRRVLATPGWTASVNNTQTVVGDKSSHPPFQDVAVPAGVSKVTYSYLPKYFVAATILSLLLVAVMLLDGAWWLARRRGRRAAGRSDEPSFVSRTPSH